jgi:hypothetical protein
VTDLRVGDTVDVAGFTTGRIISIDGERATIATRSRGRDVTEFWPLHRLTLLRRPRLSAPGAPGTP